MAQCTIEDCETPARSLGLCQKHYRRLKRNGTTEIVYINHNNVCSVENCELDALKKGMCDTHYREQWLLNKTNLCSVGNCFSAESIQGYCNKHYKKLVKYGDPEFSIYSRASSDTMKLYIAGDYEAVIESLRLNSVIVESGCWEWKTLDPFGYPRLKYQNKSWKGHRISLHSSTHQNPGKHAVHHKCANRACCNPEHLELVTYSSNNGEMMARKFYENRIAELESALRLVDPDNMSLIKE